MIHLFNLMIIDHDELTIFLRFLLQACHESTKTYHISSRKVYKLVHIYNRKMRNHMGIIKYKSVTM